MSATVHSLAARLRESAPRLAAKKAVAGFDGFVDSIVKVVMHKGDHAGAAENAATTYFQTIGEFGQYIVGKKGAGLSLETEELFQKAGGNMPIMAGALAELGVPVDCIGAMGMPGLHPAFAALHPRCRPFSFANPGFTTALEFSDGKLFLAQMKELNKSDWNVIKKTVSLDTIVGCYQHSDLVCLLNWSEVDASGDIWAGILRDVIPTLDRAAAHPPHAAEGEAASKREGTGSRPGPAGRERQFFFDLSDCSKRSPGAIREALRLVEQFGRAGQVILSLNRNEAKVLYRALTKGGIIPEIGQVGKADDRGEGHEHAENPDNEQGGDRDPEHGEDPEFLGTALCKLLYTDMLVIHTSGISYAWYEGSVYSSKPLFIPAPMLSTGAGDHFNAGFCSGLLMGFDPGLSLSLANLVAGFYMTNGRSPSIEALIANIPEETGPETSGSEKQAGSAGMD